MLIIGCDFHPRFQQIACVDQETGEYKERRLNHPEEAMRFYQSLAGQQVRVGVEATGNYRWFRRLLAELGQEMLLGDPGAIHASIPRKQQTDKRDARHILKLLVEDRFPVVWQPPEENEETRQLLLHRCRLVRMRTRLRNQMDAIAKNEGWLSKRVWCPARRAQIEALPLTGWYAQRRRDLLAMLDELERRIEPLDQAVHQAAAENADARRLMTPFRARIEFW
jgi:transposase